MESVLDFIYKEEVWNVSSFLNTSFANGDSVARELGSIVTSLLGNLTVASLERIKGPHADQIKDAVVKMAKSATVKASWVPYIEHFPYTDENTDVSYDTLGYFRFEVEYYPGDVEMKRAITPLMIQQVPIIVSGEFKKFEKANKHVNLDAESPIFIFVTSNKTIPAEIPWSDENIKKYKKSIGYWTEIYSGAWPDYNESLHDMRVENNLSNRLSELHFIRRNSGFVYMAEENYRSFFTSYMRPFVLEPTPRIRSMLYALISINHALDTLFLKRHTEGFIDVETIEKKIINLRFLRGMIQTNLSAIYDELDYNRRQHYTAVLTHLIKEFNLDRIINRINEKFSVIYDTMQELYVKKTEENQEKTERGLSLLNILFGLGVIADLASVLTAIWAPDGLAIDSLINVIVASIIVLVLLATIFTFLKIRIETRKAVVSRTVDAVIDDGKGNIVLVSREYPPFMGYHALPGSFIRPKESEKQALVRTVSEKVGVKVRVESKVGTYDTPGRDPRGRVVSNVYLCKLVSLEPEFKGDLVPVQKLKDMKIAFDHKQILADAGFE